jgi:polyisoprenoid-binding protein YceI
MEWSVLVKGFQFEKALMQQHFNENYLESHLFPKAIFKGNVGNHQSVNLGKDGAYPLQVAGNLTIHGVTKPFTGTGQVSVKGGKISVSGMFDVIVADYNIEVPKVVRDNVARTVHVQVSADLQKLN